MGVGGGSEGIRKQIFCFLFERQQIIIGMEGLFFLFSL